MAETVLDRNNILRYPRLDTVLMVEDTIKKYDGEFKKMALWKHLPKKVMYQTFCVIIDYLYESGKISIDSVGKIGWAYYPEKVRYWLSRKDLRVDIAKLRKISGTKP